MQGGGKGVRGTRGSDLCASNQPDSGCSAEAAPRSPGHPRAVFATCQPRPLAVSYPLSPLCKLGLAARTDFGRGGGEAEGAERNRQRPQP